MEASRIGPEHISAIGTSNESLQLGPDMGKSHPTNIKGPVVFITLAMEKTQPKKY